MLTLPPGGFSRRASGKPFVCACPLRKLYPLCGTCLSVSAALARLGPAQEFQEQPVAFLGCQRDRPGYALGQERTELFALLSGDLVAVAQPFLRALEAFPARQHGIEV